MEKILLPELGEGIEEAQICHWYYNEGERVKKSADLVEVSTDKATFNIPAPLNGTLKSIKVPVGENVKVGNILAEIEE